MGDPMGDAVFNRSLFQGHWEPWFVKCWVLRLKDGDLENAGEF